MTLTPYTAGSDSTTVTVASAQFTLTLAATYVYLFVSSTNCWISQGANPTASAADANMFVPANVLVTIDGATGAKLAVIRDTVDGKASLTPAKRTI